MESAKETWQKVLGELQIQVSKANYNTWLKHSRGISCQEDTFVVGVSNAFVAEWLTRRLRSLIRKTLAQVTGRDVDVLFTIYNQDQGNYPLQPSQADGGTSSKIRTERFNPRYTFDNFVVSDCNRLAYAAALEVAENPGQAYNPLFIYASTGLGKTHLLHAIGRRAASSGLQVAYISAEQFTNEFILAIKNKQVEEFRNRFKSIHILLFDDIQFIANKKQTQQSFFYIFNELYSSDRQIIITADHPPRDLTLLSSKLKSRLECGLTIPIQAPDFDARLSILQAKAKEAMTPISNEALEVLAQRIRENVRRLEGALIYLTAQARLTGEKLTLETVNKLLTSSMGKQDKKLTLQEVSEYFDVPPEDLTGKKRDRLTVLARQIAMYIMREENNYSFSEIGHELGNRNHATVIHGCSKIANEISINSKLCLEVLEIRERINQKASPQKID